MLTKVKDDEGMGNEPLKHYYSMPQREMRFTTFCYAERSKGLYIIARCALWCVFYPGKFEVSGSMTIASRSQNYARVNVLMTVSLHCALIDNT